MWLCIFKFLYLQNRNKTDRHRSPGFPRKSSGVTANKFSFLITTNLRAQGGRVSRPGDLILPLGSVQKYPGYSLNVHKVNTPCKDCAAPRKLPYSTSLSGAPLSSVISSTLMLPVPELHRESQTKANLLCLAPFTHIPLGLFILCVAVVFYCCVVL